MPAWGNMKGIENLLDAGVQRVSAHQLMLLHGAPLSDPESRRRFEFKTRFRVVARNIGDYTGEPVVETEEMVVETPSFPFEHYLQARVFHLLLTIFYHEGNFEEVFALARQCGVKPYNVVVQLQHELDQAPDDFRRVIDDFVAESKKELFETEQECAAWARNHFDGLLNGSLGGNLLSKYAMLGRFYVTRGALGFLEHAMITSLPYRGAALALDQLRAVIDYLRGILLHVPFSRTLNAAPSGKLAYDVQAWSADGYRKPLESYRFSEPRRFTTNVEDTIKATLMSRISTFGEHPAGLGKFTRTMFARDLRRTFLWEAAASKARETAKA